MNTKKTGAPESAPVSLEQQRKDTKFSATKSKSFAETEKMRISERAEARELFRNNPDKSFSRCDLENLLRKPINHITRIFDDLKSERSIVYSHSAPSECSGRNVEYFKHSGIEYKPKPQHEPQKPVVEVKQLKLFP